MLRRNKVRGSSIRAVNALMMERAIAVSVDPAQFVGGSFARFSSRDRCGFVPDSATIRQVASRMLFERQDAGEKIVDEQKTKLISNM